MNFAVERLNGLGAQALAVAWPMLWQSSLLIGLMLVMEWMLSRKVRPGVRYVLWLAVLTKLVLPPSLAFPTGVAWWVRPQTQTPQPVQYAPVVVTYGSGLSPVASESVSVPEPPKPRLSLAGGAFAGSAAVSLALLGLLIWRWRQTARGTASDGGGAPSWLTDTLDEARAAAGVRCRVRLRLVPAPMTPALFGLFRPVILLPETLARRLSVSQLRPVFLHELIHLRRGDVWVNCAQALLQIVYWWHPLVWVANSRIRRVREESVDEAVMLALRGEADRYAPTLLEVARLALRQPFPSLGLVGILESQGALRQRIERLMDFHPPRKTGMKLFSLVSVAAFSAVALPMGQAPEKLSGAEKPASAGATQVSPNETTGEEKKTEARILVQDGKLLYEMGKTDEAEKKLLSALQLDPRQQAAYYYLNLMKEARYKRQGRGLRDTTSGRQRVYGKLDKLRLDRVEFDGLPLSQVVKTLAEEAKRQDPSGDGINLILSRVASATNDTEVQDVGGITIRIAPSLINIRLADALDAVVKTADKPIKYSIEDYGVVFSLKGNAAPALYTRMIKIDPNTFLSGLRSVMGNFEPGDKQPPLELLRNFLESINVDLAPPKSIFWNDREGTVLIRATLQDLDTIETAIQAMSIAPPQLNLKARFIELSEEAEAAFWEKHREGVRPGHTVRTIDLSAAEARAQLEEWKLKGGADLLGQPSVTTLSGRQVQVQAVGLKTVVMFKNSPTSHWETNTIPFGPVLDVLPTISADQLRFDLAIKASYTEFLGYDDPGSFTDSSGAPTPAPPGGVPLPHYRVRQFPVTATVWDGQTLVMGGALDEQSQPADKPGDEQKRLVVLVTPTLIDPAGNRVHTDEEVEKPRSQTETIRAWRPTIPPRPVRR